MAKNRNTDVGKGIWPYCLAAHAIIQGGVVALITGSIWLGLAEILLHAIIDFTKCEKKISFGTDQFLHIACKILWATLAVLFASSLGFT